MSSTRRGFFETLAKVGAGFALGVSANLFLPKIEPVKWRGIRRVECFWIQTQRASCYYSVEYLEAMNALWRAPYGKNDVDLLVGEEDLVMVKNMMVKIYRQDAGGVFKQLA